MIRMAMRLALLLSLASPVLAQQNRSYPLRLEQGVPFITITVNGKPQNMMLDTGASTSTLRRVVGVPEQGVKMRTATGVVFMKKCQMTVETDSHPLLVFCGANLPLDADGLLGEDFIQKAGTMTIDYANKVVYFGLAAGKLPLVPVP